MLLIVMAPIVLGVNGPQVGHAVAEAVRFVLDFFVRALEARRTCGGMSGRNSEQPRRPAASWKEV